MGALEDIAEGDGDLTRRLNKEGNDEIALLADSFNCFANKMQHMVQQFSLMVIGC